MSLSPLLYRDRVHAGSVLAAVLRPLLSELLGAASSPSPRVLVVSLPRGGAVVGDAVAAALGASHALLFTRKIGCPGQPELALGAATDTGFLHWNDFALHQRLTENADVQRTVALEFAEARRRRALYMGERAVNYGEFDALILVDDAVATGATLTASLEGLQLLLAREGLAERVPIVVATPVAAADTLQKLERLCKHVVCPSRQREFHAASEWFQDWSEVGDEQVIALMKKAAEREAKTQKTATATAAAHTPAASTQPTQATEQPVQHSVTLSLSSSLALNADVFFPTSAAPPKGLVLFVHGSGSSRASPRNREVSSAFLRAGLATLLVDLLTEGEAREDASTGALRFDIPLLAQRVVLAAERAMQQFSQRLQGVPLALYGASTGGAAAIIAAHELSAHRLLRAEIACIISRGGRADLVPEAVLQALQVPTLLIVGGADTDVLEKNKSAYRAMAALKESRQGALGRGGEKMLLIVDGATHLFPEPGAMEKVAQHAFRWTEHWCRTARERAAAASATATVKGASAHDAAPEKSEHEYEQRKQHESEGERAFFIEGA